MEIQTLRDGKGRQFCFPHEIRVGVCNFCRAVVPFDARQTQRHHINAVDYDDILKDTIELCAKCHRRERKSNTHTA
jgi:hypothetical protein